MDETLPEIQHIVDLFKGREDVFALRWEKRSKSGYGPAYHFDSEDYRLHKQGDDTFKSYPHKSHLPLSEKEIQTHLDGSQQIGIYPLLTDNTTGFLIADFDNDNWQKQAGAFLNICKDKNIPA